MDNKKPVIPNEYKVNDRVIVKYRLAGSNHFEVYLLKNNKYLYLLKNNEEIPQANIEKYQIQKLKIGDKNFNYFVLKQYIENPNAEFYEKITKPHGFDSVAGMSDLKVQLKQDIIYPLRQKGLFDKFKLSIPNGILLYGPPGCGKTFIVRKLAEELDFSYFEVKHSDVTTPYIHGGVGKIAEIFEKAKAHAPSVVFIDELDGLAPERSELSGSQSYKLEEVNEFLTHLNDAGKNDILVIGATNQPELIDKAVLRSGRFDKKIYVMPPDFDARVHLFKMYLEGRPLKDIDYDTLSAQTVNYSCSDIEYICNDSARYAALNNYDYIDQELLLKTISETDSSIL